MKICAKAFCSVCELHPSESTLKDSRDRDVQGSLRALPMATALPHQLILKLSPSHELL